MGIDTQIIWIVKDIKHLNEGAMFGEIALQVNKPRSASIMAVTDCMFATLSKESFDKAMA
jgi:CRP-like cAMP-binding protein